MAFNNDSLIPCSLRNIWKNCKYLLYHMNFVVSHIYREGNRCADNSKGLDSQGVTICLELPDFLKNLCTHDRLGVPNFRFSNV